MVNKLSEFTESIIEAALKYLELGYSIFPLYGIENGVCTCKLKGKCKDPGKHPIEEWTPYQTRHATKQEVYSWGRKWRIFNIAIATGRISMLLILDQDGAKGIESVRKNRLIIPETLQIQTGREDPAGWHYYYRYPGIYCKSRSGSDYGLPGIDCKGDGGYVVAPPSLHKTGQHYKVLFDRPIIDAPDWFLKVATEDEPAKKGRPKGTKKTLHNGFLGKHKGNGIPEDFKTPEWAKMALLGVPEGERNTTCTRLAGLYLEYFDKEYTISFLQTSWNPLNRPPLEDAEIVKVVNSIAGRIGKEKLSDAWAIGIKKIEFFQSPDGEGRYKFEFDTPNGSKVSEFEPEEVISQAKFRAKVLGLINVFLPGLKKEVWEKKMSKALSEAEIKDIAFDATNISIVVELIQTQIQNASDQLSSANTSVVIINDFLYVTNSCIQSLLATKLHRFKRPVINNFLKTIGFEFKNRKVHGEQKKCWGMSKKQFESKYST